MTVLSDSSARKNIKPGMRVFIELKKDQRSGNLTEGIVKDVLTKSQTHPHGIKVRLESGDIGRVKEIITKHQVTFCKNIAKRDR
jgi:uncharacterized repeat protein (TIGR03833 family)